MTPHLIWSDQHRAWRVLDDEYGPIERAVVFTARTRLLEHERRVPPVSALAIVQAARRGVLAELRRLNDLESLLLGVEAPTQVLLPLPTELDLMSVSIEALGLSKRAAGGLARLGVRTLGELVVKTPRELRTPNLGRLTLREIKSHLAKMNLSLGTEPP